MTAPDMENVIVAALAGHQWYDATTDSEEPATGCTGCDDWFSDEYAVENGTFAAHQARAVLAALEAVGTVEWGVENGHEPMDYVTEDDDQNVAILRCRSRKAVGIPARVVSRLTFPWAEVGK